MTVYVCHTEEAHPKCPWGRRFVHEVITPEFVQGDWLVGTNNFNQLIAVPLDRVIYTDFAYHMARQQSMREFHESRRY